jgi:pyruvate/2-oxoglutarate dehydrogenase complex dihydrolipoamide dehydrogenase (E3) component
MNQEYDVVILGAGPGGEVALNTLAKHGARIALVESELIGGECTNWGCIPSKTLLRPAELAGACTRAAGVGRPPLDWPALSAYRDYMVSNHDDSGRVKRYEERGIRVVKARGGIAGPGRVETDAGVLHARAIVVATGSEAVVPPIPGLAESGYWTNREATALTVVPQSTVVIGGGAVGIELAQFLARFGSRVTLVEGSERLAPREPAEIGEALADILEGDGIDVRLAARATSVRVEDGRRVVTLEDGSEPAGEALVVAVGRSPRVHGIGLDTVGIEPNRRGVEIDSRCRAGEGVWAIGDVTGVAAFTHVAKYQARIAGLDILGEAVEADYRAVPRVTFTDPEVAAVGITTEEEARRAGIRPVTATIDMASSIARPYTVEQHPRGAFGVIVDGERQVLVGAWAVAPLAGEWIHQSVLAIRARIPVAVLRETIAQFPSFSEALGTALRALPDCLEASADHEACPQTMASVM